MFFLFSFFFGLAVGSFLNVVLCRFTPEAVERKNFSLGRTLRGRSHCDSCGKTLVWFELFPLVSFFWQKARCRGCQVRLSWQYPLVEFLTGLAFLTVAWRLSVFFPLRLSDFSFFPQLWILGLVFFWWLIFAVLILIAAYDFKYYLIPDLFLYALLILTFLLNVYYFWLSKKIMLFGNRGLPLTGELSYLLGGSEWSWIKVAAGALFGVLVIGLAYVLSRGRAMGFGDVLLVLGLGLAFAWPDILLVMFLSFVFGTLVSLALMALKRKTLKSIVPFGPFLVLAALTVFAAGDTIIAGYLRLFPALLLGL